MQEKRSYQTVEEGEAKFDELIVRLRKRGDLMLPPERQLCEIIGCSRNTARKLLRTKVDSGVIVKKRFGYTLSLESAANKKVIGAFSFVSMGNSFVHNPAWAKLWARLQTKAEAAGICAELALIPPNDENFSWSDFKRSLQKVVVVTTLDNGAVNELLATKGHTFITTESHNRELFKNVIALDNFKAGFLAAKVLAEHGYKHPAMISHILIIEKDGKPYLQYVKRVEGFEAGCRKFGLAFDEKSLLTVEGKYGAHIKFSIAKRAMEMAKMDFDSVFLHTDGELEFLLEGFASEKVRIPEDIGVITLNSFDVALQTDPPVCAISHGTEPMADMLVEKLKGIFLNGEKTFGEILVEPGIHEGRSLK